MRTKVIVLAGVALAGFGCWSAHSGDDRRQPAAPRAEDELVKRGAYLTNEVARCGDCHTPRTQRGRPDRTRHLQGGDLWFAPKAKAREWEGRAPDITRSGKAGKWTEARMVRLLTTGKESDPPMPAYHLTEDDARAIAAYLRSLPGKKGGDKQEGREKRKGKGRRERREREDDD